MYKHKCTHFIRLRLTAKVRTTPESNSGCQQEEMVQKDPGTPQQYTNKGPAGEHLKALFFSDPLP